MENPIVKRSTILWASLAVVFFLGLFFYSSSQSEDYWELNQPDKVITIKEFKDTFADLKEALIQVHYLHNILIYQAEIVMDSSPSNAVSNSFLQTEISIASLKYAFQKIT